MQTISPWRTSSDGSDMTVRPPKPRLTRSKSIMGRRLCFTVVPPRMALLVAAGHNLRLILATLTLLRALILLAQLPASVVKPDTSSRPSRRDASMA